MRTAALATVALAAVAQASPLTVDLSGKGPLLSNKGGSQPSSPTGSIPLIGGTAGSGLGGLIGGIIGTGGNTGTTPPATGQSATSINFLSDLIASGVTVVNGLDLGVDLVKGLNGQPTQFFTSAFQVTGTPAQVVDSTNKKTGGLPGAKAIFTYGFNSVQNILCYNIQLDGFQGTYATSTGANTATHIHQALVEKSGPPRIAIPNPRAVQGSATRVSEGCIIGPFTTGVKDANGDDTGKGFNVRAIELNPASFFTDIHSSQALPGALRAQLK